MRHHSITSIALLLTASWTARAGTPQQIAREILETSKTQGGLIAAAGHLFLSTTDGRVMCFGKP